VTDIPDGFQVEDIREALAAAERWGGIDDHLDGEGIPWRAPNAIKAMGFALRAALRSRARRERSRQQYDEGSAMRLVVDETMRRKREVAQMFAAAEAAQVSIGPVCSICRRGDCDGQHECE